MEIVLGMYRLHDPGGTEHYTLIVAEQLQRLGHVVTIFVEETGAMAELARSRGLRLAAREDELPDDVDVLYAQESITAYRLTARYPKAPLVYGLHAVDYDLSVPPQLPELVSAYVTAHDRISRRAQAFAVTAEVVRLRQPVDLARFTPRANLSEPPRRLLALGNYLHGDRARVIEDACARAGIEVLRVGAQNGDRVLEAERVLNDVDIVVGKARVIVEAMACGRAAYVFDTFGSDGWVTKDSYARLEADNFSGQTGTPPVDVAQRPRALPAGHGRREPRAGGRQPQREHARGRARRAVRAARSETGLRGDAAPGAEPSRPCPVADRGAGDVPRRRDALRAGGERATEAPPGRARAARVARGQGSRARALRSRAGRIPARGE
jgi:hypothetical protein